MELLDVAGTAGGDALGRTGVFAGAEFERGAVGGAAGAVPSSDGRTSSSFPLGKGTSSGSRHRTHWVRLPAFSSGACMTCWHRGQAKTMSMGVEQRESENHAWVQYLLYYKAGIVHLPRNLVDDLNQN